MHCAGFRGGSSLKRLGCDEDGLYLSCGRRGGFGSAEASILACRTTSQSEHGRPAARHIDLLKVEPFESGTRYSDVFTTFESRWPSSLQTRPKKVSARCIDARKRDRQFSRKSMGRY